MDEISLRCAACAAGFRSAPAADAKTATCPKCSAEVPLPSPRVRASQWYYQLEGEEIGPVGFAQLQKCAAKGFVTPESKVRAEGIAEPFAARRVPQLFAAVGTQPQPPAPPEPPEPAKTAKAPRKRSRVPMFVCLGVALLAVGFLIAQFFQEETDPAVILAQNPPRLPGISVMEPPPPKRPPEYIEVVKRLSLPEATPESLAERDPIAPGGGAPVVVLEPLVWRQNYYYLGSRPVFLRELVRQSILIAARDELGLATRDIVLREPAEADAAEVTLGVESVPVAKQSAVRLYRSAGANPGDLGEITIDLSDRGEFAYESLLPQIEEASRKAWPTALRKAGFGGRRNRAADDAKLPDELAEKLERFNVVDQFAAVRGIHALIRSAGENEVFVGALVRCYANLGAITEHLPSAVGKAFKARAVLYAQRMLAARDDRPARWHRLYAATLAGYFPIAREDRKALGEVKPGDPDWAPLLLAYLDHDTKKIEPFLAHPKLDHLANLLDYVLVEDVELPGQTLAAAERQFGANIENFRVWDGLCDVGGLSILHRATTAPIRDYQRSVPARLAQTRDLPGPAADAAGDPESLWGAAALLTKAARPSLDRGEPSWAVLGGALADQQFLMAWRRLSFMKFWWGVETADSMAEMRPMFQGHPFQEALELLGPDRTLGTKEAAEVIRRIPVGDLWLPAGWLHRVRERLAQPDVFKFSIAMQSQYDPLIYEAKGRVRDERFAFNRGPLIELLEIDPLSEIGRAAQLRRMWKSPGDDSGVRLLAGAASWGALRVRQSPEFEAQAAKWSAEPSRSGAVPLQLARLYAESDRFDESAAHFRTVFKRSNDASLRIELARGRLRAGKPDDYLAELVASLKAHDHGLMHSTAQGLIADHHMNRGEWAKAMPYADEAAESGSGSSMLTAMRCAEGLKDWAKAERYVRATSERYRTLRNRWMMWCLRTNKGDLAAARKLFMASAVPLEQLTQYEVLSVAWTLWADRQTGTALNVAKRAAIGAKFIGAGTLAVYLADLENDTATRDLMLASIVPDKPDPMFDLLNELQSSFRAGKPIDAKRAVAIVEKVTPETNRTYHRLLLASVLRHHGMKADANRLLADCVKGPFGEDDDIRTLVEVTRREWQPGVD